MSDHTRTLNSFGSRALGARVVEKHLLMITQELDLITFFYEFYMEKMVDETRLENALEMELKIEKMNYKVV